MKTKLITSISIVALLLGSVSPVLASEENGPLAVAVDAVVARPACFVATVIGSALFVIALPVAATSKSVKKTADALVVKPAKATFTRPMGDLDSLRDY